jgi:hypothetical protein
MQVELQDVRDVPQVGHLPKYSKLGLLSTIITKENAEGWLNKAKSLSRSVLREEIR